MPTKKKAKSSSRQPRWKAAKKKRKRTAKKRTRRAPAEAPPPSDPRFVRDLLVRGEAASLTPEGKLPQEATHVITGGAADTSTIKRARFKTF